MTGPFANHAKKAVETMRADWASQITKDPEMGSKVDSIKVDIGRMKDTILGPGDDRKAFDEAMNLTGAGDHPAVVRAMWKLAQRLNEGTYVTGSAPSKHGQVAPGQPARPSAAQALYPNLPH